MIEFKELKDRKYKEEFKIASLFNIKMDEVALLQYIGFEYVFDTNSFKGYIKINGENKYVRISHNGNDSIRLTLSESDSKNHFFEVTVGKNDKRSELSILPLIFWLEYKFNQLDNKKSFGEFVETEKSN